MRTEPVHILIVDDNDTDLMIMREALSETSLNATLHVAGNGEDAMKFLRRVGEHAQAPRPDLILLDLNMPRKNGHEVLSEIKSDQLLIRIPVVILTTSQAEDDVAKAYAAHANCYIRKPMDFGNFEKIVGKIEQFWFNVVTLPAIKPPR
jgi:chemotaxis family two-component system response regulator Rcp1